jgi:hypothetical protein
LYRFSCFECSVESIVWLDVPAARTKRMTARHRADQMAHTLEENRADVAVLVERIAPDLVALDRIVAIVALRDRLTEAEHARLTKLRERAEQHHGTLHAEQKALATLVGVADPRSLATTADRIGERDRYRSEVLRLLGALIDQGDGHPEAALRTECAALSADAVAARMQAIEEDDRILVDELGSIRAASEIAQGQRADLEGGRGADNAAQEEAVAAAGLAARLEATCVLIAFAIERHRSRYQDPLIARASQLFAALTGNSFAGLSLDYREDDVLTIVAERWRDTAGDPFHPSRPRRRLGQGKTDGADRSD